MPTIGLVRNKYGTWDKDDPFFENKAFAQLHHTTDVFHWLDSEYQRRRVSRKENNDYLLAAEFFETIEYQGDNPAYQGQTFARWLNTNVKQIEYLFIDLDDLQKQTSVLVFDEVVRRFEQSGLTFRLWPSFSHNNRDKLKYRAVIQLKHPIINDTHTDVTRSKKQALDQLSDLLGIAITDDSNKTWSQKQGAPLKGDPYAKGQGEPLNNTIIKKKEGERLNIHTLPPINKTAATQIINHYIERDAENLKEEFNCFSALMVLATSVQTGEITEEQGYTYAKKFADVADNESQRIEWQERNIKRLQTELNKRPNLDVWYTFEEKFKKTITVTEKLPTSSEIASELAERFTFKPITFDGGRTSQLGVYDEDEGIYHIDEEKIYRIIKQETSVSGRAKVKDVAFDLKYMVDSVKQKETPHLIPVRNGVYNLETQSLESYSKDLIFTSKIETNYNPNATNPKEFFDVDKWFEDISCGDKEVEQLLLQIINEAINGNRTRGKYFILAGVGANGKSTFLDMITHLVGDTNTSHVKIHNLQSRFGKQALVGKIVNLGDDITSSKMTEIDIVKNIATGDIVEIEGKNKDSYFMPLRTALIFTANEIPQFDDTSHGNLRRRVIVPFNANFTENGDPLIREKYIKDKRVREYILLKALQAPFHNDVFIEPQIVKEANEKQRETDNTIYNFYKSVGKELLENNEPYFTSDFVNEYRWWCHQNGFEPQSQARVTRETKLLLGEEWTTKTTNINGVRAQAYRQK